MNNRAPTFFAWKLFLLAAFGAYCVLAAICLLHWQPQADANRSIDYVINGTQGIVCETLALLIGWRRAGSKIIRTLALIFIAAPSPWLIDGLPPGPVRDALAHVYPVSLWITYAGFLFLTVQFPLAAPFIMRPRVRLAFFASTLVFAAVCAVTLVPAYIDQVRPMRMLCSVVLVLASLVALSRAWLQTTGTERQRIGWIAFCIGSVFATYATYLLAFVSGNDMAGGRWAVVLDAIQLCGYVTLAYAMLRYRLFDVGFVINRTLVFSVTSLLLILVFFLAERVVHGLLHFEEHGGAAWVDGAVAFVIFFGFNRLHHRVDHLVERMLFGSWHHNAKTLREFVRTSAHYTDADDLRLALGDELTRFSGGAPYAMYRAGADGRFVMTAATLDGAPASFGPNADLAVSMRASRKELDLGTMRSAHVGDLAFPMMQGARLDGMVILGHKPSGDNYRPDEIEALAFAVAQIGLVLFALRVEQLEQQNGAGKNELGLALRELDAMRQLLARPDLAGSQVQNIPS